MLRLVGVNGAISLSPSPLGPFGDLFDLPFLDGVLLTDALPGSLSVPVAGLTDRELDLVTLVDSVSVKF